MRSSEGRVSPAVADAVTSWWGGGPPPTERWPGVTIPIDGMGGKYHFDPLLADRVCAFFPRFCSHSKGEFAGKAFTPLDYQAQLILRPIFGWVDEDGRRRFRKAFIEIPKKNGKTQLIAGLALYMLLGDSEPGAEVYVAAADREQARILFDAAKSMVEGNQSLAKRLIVFRNRIVRRDDPSAFFQVLSAEAATKHGPNIHCLIIDELHAQPDRDLFETLTRGVIARRQPLILLITTAGDDDESICVAPDTRLLTDDLRWVKAGDVQPGDVLAGFDEHRRFKKSEQTGVGHRMWRRSPVLQRSVAVLPSYELRLSDGTCVVCSEDHMWLIQTAGRRTEWKKTKHLSMTDSFCKVLEPWARDTSWDGGYLAGVLDSEGHLSATARSHMLCGFTQKENVLSARCRETLTSRRFNFGIYETTHKEGKARGIRPIFQTMVTRKRDVLRMLGSLRPPRLLQRFAEIGWEHLRFKAHERPVLVSKTFVGDRQVVGLKTESHTFVAEGLGSHNCFEEYDYARRVLSGTIADERHLPVIFEAGPKEDWADPAVLTRVNPGVGSTIELKTLLEGALEAKNEPRKRNGFIRYHTNRWTNQATAWIPIEWWDACEGPLDEALLLTLECGAGLDLAQKWDLACFCVVFRRWLPGAAEEITVLAEEAEGKVEKKMISLNYELFVRPYFWIPENTMRQHEKDDKVPYSLWKDAGLVTATDGDVIDYSRIYTDIKTKIVPRYPRLKQGTIGYDPAFATDLATKLRDLAGLNVLEVLQNYKMLSEPAQIVEALIKGKRVHHDGHRVLRWNWENAAVKTDDAGRIRPVKPKRASKRVDGAVALIMGQKVLSMDAPTPPTFRMLTLGTKR